MNVNRLYVAQINIVFEEIPGSIRGRFRETEIKGRFLKYAIVYHDDNGRYIDLISGENYKLGIGDTDLGDMYIYLKKGLMPITEVYDVDFKRNDMSKKRILKTLYSSKLLNKKEDDK